MSEKPANNSPYKGLQAYTESDRKFFFGRERDQEIITSNLFASPLTVFYGASGVGKSSVLLAGVVPQLRRTPRAAVVVFREWQDAGFEGALKREVINAIEPGSRSKIDPALELDEFLLACTNEFRGSLFFILDQFEEYFLYHPTSEQTERFDAAFARTINRSEIGANFLLSMRDDGLSRLDRFKKRIPNLLNNMLRLEHLSRASAELAIRRPLAQYNESRSDGESQAGIEDGLVTVLLEDLQTGKVTLDLTGQGKVDTNARADRDGRIETPFLQVVLTRLWEEEQQAAASDGKDLTLRLATYRALGAATKIVRTHLDQVMETERLRPHRDTAAALFHFLVTPAGMKIAHTGGDLASYARSPAAEVEQTLNALSAPDVRILRPIAPPPDQPTLLRYEIFHDVLAPAILDWRARYTKIAERREADLQAAQQRKRAEAEAKSARRFRRLSYTLGVVCLVALAAGIAALANARTAQTNASTALAYASKSDTLRKEGQRLIKIARTAQDSADRAASFAAQAGADAADWFGRAKKEAANALLQTRKADDAAELAAKAESETKAALRGTANEQAIRKLSSEAEDSLFAGNKRGAVEKFRTALERFPPDDSLSGKADMLARIADISIGEILYVARKPQELAGSEQLAAEKDTARKLRAAERENARKLLLETESDLTQASESYAKHRDFSRQARTLKTLGELFDSTNLRWVYEKDKDGGKSTQYYEAALVLYKEKVNDRSQRISILRKFVAETDKADKKKAIEYYKRLRSEYQNYDPVNEAKIAVILGDLYVELKEKTMALTSYKQALESYTIRDDRAARALMLNKLAAAHDSFDEKTAALERYRERLAVLEMPRAKSDTATVGTKTDKAGTLRKIGKLIYEQGHKPEAYDTYERAAKLYAEVVENLQRRPSPLPLVFLSGYGQRAASMYAELGELYRKDGEREKSITAYTEAAKHYAEAGKHGEQAQVLTTISETYALMGNTVRAEEFKQKATEARNRVKANDTRAR